MPVEMTRAEYKAKYGLDPITLTQDIDPPAPNVLTRNEYQNQYGYSNCFWGLAELVRLFFTHESTLLNNTFSEYLAFLPQIE